MTRAFRFLAPMGLCVAIALAVPAALAQGTLNIYCSVQAEWCQAVANEFQRQTGIRVALTLKGSGETLAQVTAEAQNPKGDVWFGGTGDPHLAAAEQNLTVAYKSPNLDKLHDWARRQAEQSGFKTVGIYAGALGFGYNPELLQKKKLAAPACWKDLIKADFKDEIQIANPNSSGTAYTAIATIVQLFGEEEAFRYLRQLHRKRRLGFSVGNELDAARASVRSKRWRAARRPSASASCTTASPRRSPAFPSRSRRRAKAPATRWARSASSRARATSRAPRSSRTGR